MNRGVSVCLLTLMTLGAPGCERPLTSVLLHVENDPGAPTPTALRITLFGALRLGPPRVLSLTNKPLPGTVLIRDISAATPNFRVLVEGLDASTAVLSQAAVK